MSHKNDRVVYKRKDGKWVNKKVDAENPTSLHETQKEAEDTAREILKNSGGGELITMGLDGKIRSKDTIKPGHEDRKVKDKEF